MTNRTRRGREGHLRSGERPELFDTAEADSISLSEGPVNCPRLGNPHFGATDEGRRVRGIGITVTYESVLATGPIDCCLEHPAFNPWVTELLLDHRSDSGTAVALSHTEEAGMRDVPSSIQELQMAGAN
jgi:hypothetical protein